MSYDSKSPNFPLFHKSNEQTPSKKQSILKKTPSRNSFQSNDRRNTPSKNVKFDSKVNVNQFFSSPNEKTHEILINSHDFEQKFEENMDFLNDETVWSNTKKSIDNKSECLEEEIQQIEKEIRNSRRMGIRILMKKKLNNFFYRIRVFRN